MRNIFLLGLIFIFIFNCTKKELEEISNERFPILAYDSEISESLSMDLSEINIDLPRDVIYWSQHFQNPNNDLNNIASKASFKKKSKIISGKGEPINILQPIFFNNKLCHVLSNGYLECFDTSIDKKILSIDLKSDGISKYEIIRGGLAYFDDKVVYVDAYGQVVLINITSQQIEWSTNVGFPILSPPLVYRDRIYFISSDNRIFSLFFNDGSVDWSFQTISESKKNLFTASPVAYENTIIVPFSNGELVAFKFDTGRPLWSENLSKFSIITNFDINDISGSPVINKNSIYALSSNGKLVALNSINGTRNWTIDFSGYRTPLISGNQIFVINEDAKLICLNKDSGDIYWITDLGKYRKGAKAENLNMWLGPYMINSLLFNISYFGEVMAVSPLTGDILMEENIGIREILAPPIITSESIFVANGNSDVFKFK